MCVSSINCASARCRRATASAQRVEARARQLGGDVELEPADAQRRRRRDRAPRKRRPCGSPQRRISTFSASEAPTGTLACGKVRHREHPVAQACLNVGELALERRSARRRARRTSASSAWRVLAAPFGRTDLLGDARCASPAAPACASGSPCARFDPLETRRVERRSRASSGASATPARSLRRSWMSSIVDSSKRACGRRSAPDSATRQRSRPIG